MAPETKRREGGLRRWGVGKKPPLGVPFVSIITAVLNAAEALEETILSVLRQTYPHREYLIIDGGSWDGTVEVLERYDAALDYWLSEPDRGIYDAFNKGIRLAQGDWLYFLGAGDRLADERVLEEVFSEEPQEKFLYGDVVFLPKGRRYGGRFSKLRLCRRNLCQQAVFYHRDLFQKFGLFETQYPLAADWAFNLHCFGSPEVSPRYLRRVIALCPTGGASSRSWDSAFLRDRERLLRRLGKGYGLLYKVYRLLKPWRREPWLSS